MLRAFLRDVRRDVRRQTADELFPARPMFAARGPEGERGQAPPLYSQRVAIFRSEADAAKSLQTKSHGPNRGREAPEASRVRP